MFKSLVLVFIISTLFVSTVVFAQESPFGNLANEEKTNRTVLSVEGQTLADYMSVKANYENLVELHERAFGTRKIELAGQMISRAKDVLVSKLGATQTFLANLIEDVRDTMRFPEENMASLEEISTAFNEQTPDYLIQIEEKTSVDELKVTSRDINKSISEALDGSVKYVAILSVARGQFLIELIDTKAPIIQAHINASADLGGNVEEVQQDYNGAMLSMEKARDEYKVVAGAIGDDPSIDAQESSEKFRTQVRKSNVNLRVAYDGLEGVLNDLRILYSRSPWEIDKTQFDVKEEG